ncbi:efflux RND transporter periplasmic adaptor subunit [Pendulispora albinea]|uniref:Efflux RND transporter periplasmic adaptor subunit n=1 Tax=Pendulispora albinea TaxID=2741071 RepID=A0ABZ2LQE8_9BACT
MGRLRLLFCAMACVAYVGACHKKQAEEPPEVKPEADVQLGPAALQAAGLSTGKPRRVERRSSVAVTGVLEFVPNRVARVGPLIEGRVVSIRVDPGQHVAPGTVLATVESVEIGKARSDFLASQVKMQYAERERVRQHRLADAGVTTGQSVINAETDRDLANLEIRAAAERLRAVGVNLDDLTHADAGAGSGRPSTAMSLRTPLGGLVLDVNARVGQAVSATDTLFVVGEIDKVWLIVDVYERDLAKVHAGDEAKARVVAYPDRTFTGRVDYVGGIVDAVRRAVPARIVLENPDGALRPGMSASAHIFGAAAPAEGVDSGSPQQVADRVLVVPRGAIQTIDGQPFVFVEKGEGKYALRAVERGAALDRDVEILRGLTGDETIVTDGTFVLKSEALREQMGKND